MEKEVFSRPIPRNGQDQSVVPSRHPRTIEFDFASSTQNPQAQETTTETESKRRILRRRSEDSDARTAPTKDNKSTEELRQSVPKSQSGRTKSIARSHSVPSVEVSNSASAEPVSSTQPSVAQDDLSNPVSPEKKRSREIDNRAEPPTNMKTPTPTDYQTRTKTKESTLIGPSTSRRNGTNPSLPPRSSMIFLRMPNVRHESN